MKDCFLYNRGHSTHPNLLHFDGCFLSELKEDTNAFFQETLQSDEEDEEEDDEEEKGKPAKVRTTFQVGLISEHFRHVTLCSYMNYFVDKKIMEEDKVLLILGQLVRTLAHCQRKNVQHHDLRPQTIFVQDHSKPVLGYFGKAKFMGK